MTMGYNRVGQVKDRRRLLRLLPLITKIFVGLRREKGGVTHTHTNFLYIFFKGPSKRIEVEMEKGKSGTFSYR